MKFNGNYYNAKQMTNSRSGSLSLATYLSKGLENLLALAEVPEEEVQGTRYQGRIVVHDQVEQDTQESASALAIQVQVSCIASLAVEDALRLHPDGLQIDVLLAGSGGGGCCCRGCCYGLRIL